MKKTNEIKAKIFSQGNWICRLKHNGFIMFFGANINAFPIDEMIFKKIVEGNKLRVLNINSTSVIYGLIAK